MSVAKDEKQHPLLLYLATGAFLAYVIFSRVALYISRRRFIKQNGCRPAQARYPYKDPFFAIDLMRENFKRHAERRVLYTSQARFQRLGNTFSSRIFTQPVIQTIEPENIKAVLSVKFKDFSLGAREKSFGPLLGHGIFNTDGERWANSRHMIRPNFAREQVADIQAFERHLAWLFKAIPIDGSTIDLQELFFKMTIDSATEFLFGHSTHSLKTIDTDAYNEDMKFAEAFTIAQADVLARARMGNLGFLRNNRKGKEATRLVHAYVDKYVDAAIEYRKSQDVEKAGKEDKYVFLHELAKSTQDRKRLRDELLNVLLAGRDTTAGLLSNMFFEIARQPEIWAKLREEVAVLDGKPPTYEQLRGFKYVKYCLNESLRLHPSVPGNSRLAIHDTCLPLGGGGDGQSPLFVPKGTLVAYHVFSMMRREDFYGPDANQFIPERWETLRPGWEYLPFNGGPRICLGQQYALTEAGYVLVRMVQRYGECISRDSRPWTEALTLTLASGNGTLVGLVPN